MQVRWASCASIGRPRRGFLEKPQTSTSSKTSPPIQPGLKPAASKPTAAIASRHGHLFVRSRDARRRVGKDELPRFWQRGISGGDSSQKVQLHPFDGYWEDIGTIRSFYDENLRLAQQIRRFN